MKNLKKNLLIAVLLSAVLCGSAFASSHLEINGRYSYKFRGSQIRLKMDKIYNYSPKGSASGTVRLALWATKRPYTGGRIHGYRVADVHLGVLYGGNHFYDIDKTTTIKRPPAGYYWMTIAVTEYDRGAYRIVDYRNFDNQQRF